MLFGNYRMMKRLGKRFVKGSVLFSAPVLVAGACGLIGLAALIYLKRRADNDTQKSFAGFKEVKHPCRSRHHGAAKAGSSKGRTEYSEDDFIVIDADEEDIREAGEGFADSEAQSQEAASDENSREASEGIWIASVTSKTFHRPDCSRIGRIAKANRKEIEGSIESLMGEGYKPCASCIGK